MVIALFPDVCNPGGFSEKGPLGVGKMEKRGGGAQVTLGEANGGFEESASLVKLSERCV